MMKLSANVVEVDEMKPLPVCCLPFALNTEHVEPQLSETCPEASLAGRDRKEAIVAAEENTPKSAIGTFNMHTSDACHRNFVIFDHCEGQNTVIVHPSWLRGLQCQSYVEPSSVGEANYFLDNLQIFNSKQIETLFGFPSQGAWSPAFGDTRGPVLQAQLKSSNMQNCNFIDQPGCKALHLNSEGLSRSMPFDVEQETLSCEFHENTDEINALLSSDDELSSTGHSPSDGASHCFNVTMNGPITSIIEKKRKLEDSDESDDADSGSGKLALGQKPPNIETIQNANSVHFLSNSSDPNSIQSGVGGAHTFDMKTMSFSSKGAEQAKTNQGQCASNQIFQMFGEGGLVESSKRIKVRGNVEQLKNVLPGGNLLDTADVLDRTIHYVKCLQNKLRGLEAARESARAMHQAG